MLVEINPTNIDIRLIQQAVDVLKSGGVIIFPTDTVYSMGCDLYNKKGLNELAKLKNIKLNKANFSIICSDLSHLSEYVKQLDRSVFKLLKQYLENRPEVRPNGAKLKLINHISHIRKYKKVASLNLKTFKILVKPLRMIKIIYFVNLSAVILSLAKIFAIFVVKKI